MTTNANQYPDLGPTPSGAAAGAPARSASNGKAIASMVLGIVGLVMAFLFTYGGVVLGVIALVLGVVARRQGESVPGRGRGMILAGIVLGVLAIALSVVTIIVRIAQYTS